MAKTEVRRFRNTSTGLVEEVTHAQTIALMEDSDRYEEVKDEKKSETKAPTQKTSTPAEPKTQGKPADQSRPAQHQQPKQNPADGKPATGTPAHTQGGNGDADSDKK